MLHYFDLLHISPAFNLDLKSLESAYLTQQRQYHPDRFVTKSPAERQQALLRSVEINAAYQTLKNPLSRAQYLLHLQGIAVATEVDTVKPAQALLMETLEWREMIEAANSAKEIQAVNELLDKMLGETLHDIALKYEAQDWQSMAQSTLRLVYVQKALAAIPAAGRGLRGNQS